MIDELKTGPPATAVAACTNATTVGPMIRATDSIGSDRTEESDDRGRL